MKIRLTILTLVAILVIAATSAVPKVSNPPVGAGQDLVENGKKNIIAIQLESFQSFVLGREVDGQVITPNLNKLIEESLYYPNFYLQNGSGNTVDAEFMFNTSLHPLAPGNVVSNSESQRELPSLPRFLRTQGYQTVTMHTNNAMFYNRKEFYSALGFNAYFDKKFFGTKDFFAFGSVDDILYEKGLPILEGFAEEWQPFYAHLITMTSHHPFTIPKKFRQLALPEAYEGNIVGDYLQATHYTDVALGRLIDEMKRTGLWENTVLVLYGDHTGIQMQMLDEAGMQAMEQFLGRPYTQGDTLQVPFLIHATDLAPKKDLTYGGHLDMMPTLMGVMDFTVPGAKWFGYDLTKGTPHPVAVRGAFADPGSFVDQGNLFNPLKGTVLDLATGVKRDAAAEEYQAKYDIVLDRFRQSDEYIASLPNKTEDFGETVVLTEDTPFFLEAKEAGGDRVESGLIIPPSEVTATEKAADGWYKITYREQAGWIQPVHPIVEVWGLTKTEKKTQLYEEPDENSAKVLAVGVQNINYSQEWVGKGWYKFVTWAGEYWGKLE
jgi:phosphoglycerol transferase MdoB-like AlkP superfamily enzyme